MSKKNQRKKMKNLRYERLIDANDLKKTIIEAAKQKGTEDAMKKAQAFNGLVDLQPTKYDEKESIGRSLKMFKERVIALEGDLHLQKITKEQYDYEMSIIVNEISVLEARFGIPIVEEKQNDNQETANKQQSPIKPESYTDGPLTSKDVAPQESEPVKEEDPNNIIIFENPGINAVLGDGLDMNVYLVEEDEPTLQFDKKPMIFSSTQEN